MNRSIDNNHKYHNQVGWDGVPTFSLPPLIAETPEGPRRSVRSLDTLFGEEQGKSGLFFAMFQKGTVHGDAFRDVPEVPAVSMFRRTGESIWFALRTGRESKSKPENTSAPPCVAAITTSTSVSCSSNGPPRTP